MIDISGLSKAKILASLYNNSQPLGLGFYHFDPASMERGKGDAGRGNYPV